MRFTHLFCVALAALCFGVACGNQHGNGVNDVKLACELRAGWTEGDSKACRTCEISAKTSPDCDCTRDEYRGACYAQQEQQAYEPQCNTAVHACLADCAPNDCDCKERCFDGLEACKRATAALEGCLTDLCAAVCQ